MDPRARRGQRTRRTRPPARRAAGPPAGGSPGRPGMQPSRGPRRAGAAGAPRGRGRELFALIGLASPLGPPLPVWIPSVDESANRWALRLLKAAANAGITDSEDPTDPPEPSHQVSWSEGRRVLASPDADVADLGANPEIAKLIDRLQKAPPPVRIQVQLPVAPALEGGLGLGEGGPRSRPPKSPIGTLSRRRRSRSGVGVARDRPRRRRRLAVAPAQPLDRLR